MQLHGPIAVVDDEDSVRRALERVLRANGMEVVTFRDGEELLEAMKALTVRCVVLDLHMPKMSGFDVLEAITRDTSHPPVVVITGHDSPEARDRALACHAAAYLTKPIDEQLLLGEIEAATAARKH
jgi:FixJ family two-component response regulator